MVDDGEGAKVRAVLDFWFGAPGEPNAGQPRKIWFEKDAAFDGKIRARFAGEYGAARDGGRAAWRGSAQDCLALVIVLDQFPRNLFRGDARAFATDAAALEAAKHAIARGYDRALPPLRRTFLYMPFLHSENIGDQDSGIELIRSLGDAPMAAESLKAAIQHRDIIARFGRFPHRNAVLGRATTAEEAAFLKQPVSSF